MTAPDPAAELREAARLMRKRAEEATPGPWHALKSGDGQECYVISRDYGQVATGMHDEPDAAEFVLIERDQRDADHIASMNPLVAFALADWLEAEADRAATGVWALHALTPGPLKFARTYLGTADD